MKPVPSHWVYVIAWSASDGVVQFRDDIYNRDGLGAPAGSPTAQLWKFVVGQRRRSYGRKPLFPKYSGSCIRNIQDLAGTDWYDPPGRCITAHNLKRPDVNWLMYVAGRSVALS